MAEENEVEVETLPSQLFRSYYFMAILSKSNRTYIAMNDDLETTYLDYCAQCIASGEKRKFNLEMIKTGLTAENPQVVGHNLSFSFRLGVYDRRERVIEILPNLQIVR